MKNAPALPARHHDRPAAGRTHSPRDSVRPPQLPSHGAGPLDPHAVRRQEQILDELLRVGLDPEQALAQIHRLEAGDVWSG